MNTLNGFLSGTVSDARFAATNGVDILLAANNCNQMGSYLTVSATSYLGVPPQLTGPPPVAGFTAMPTNSGYSYWLRSSTNCTLPLSSWSLVATNWFDAYGNYSDQIPVTPETPQQFYRMQLP